MKKKILTIILSLVACVCLAFGITGCEYSSSGGASWDESKYTGFDVPEALVLNKGAFYEVSKPITLDVYGNVLPITFQVKNSTGAVENEIPAGFFALDDNGYTIQYSTRLPNGNFLRKETKVYVLSYTDDVNFYDASMTDMVDLTQFLPAGGIPAGYTADYVVTQRGNLVENAVRRGQFPAQNLESGVYDISVNLISGSGSVFVLRDLSVDVGDLNAPVWRSGEMKASDLHVAGYYSVMSDTVEVIDAANGGVPGKTSGLFYKIDPTNEQIVSQGTDVNVRILPAHSKAYYQRFAGQGYKLKFSFAMDIPEGDTWIDTWHIDKDTNEKLKTTFMVNTFTSNGPKLIEGAMDTWYDMVINLDDILPYFDSFNNWIAGGDPGYKSFIDVFRGLAYGETEVPENDGDTLPPAGTEKNDIRFYITPVTISK